MSTQNPSPSPLWPHNITEKIQRAPAHRFIFDRKLSGILMHSRTGKNILFEIKIKSLVNMYKYFLWATLLLSLGGCEADTTAVSYIAINHTPKYIESIAINDEGGILDVPAMGGGGGEVCCVVIPRQWHDGLKVKISWKQGSHAKLDKNGREIIEDGVPVVTEGTWKSRVVSIHEYDSVHLGRMHIHFMPNDQVIVKIGNFAYRAPGYYPPYPEPSTAGGKN